MQQQSSNKKKMMFYLGIICIILGVVFVILGLLSFLGVGATMGDTMNDVQNTGQIPSLGGFFTGGLIGVLFFGLGFVFIMIGGVLIYLSQLRRITSYVATEVSPAVTTVTHTAGQGIASGIKDGGGIALTMNQPQTATPTSTIKMKCRSCGYLETEDAEFCSKCGNKL